MVEGKTVNPANCWKKGKLPLKRMALALSVIFFSLGLAEIDFLFQGKYKYVSPYYGQETKRGFTGQAKQIQLSYFPISPYFSKDTSLFQSSALHQTICPVSSNQPRVWQVITPLWLKRELQSKRLNTLLKIRTALVGQKGSVKARLCLQVACLLAMSRWKRVSDGSAQSSALGLASLKPWPR